MTSGLRAAVLLLALAAPASGRAGDTAAGLREAEERASAELSARVQNAFDRRFGPGRASVSANVRLRLSRRGSDWIGRLLAPPKRGGDPAFTWLGVGNSQGGGRFELPGIPSDDEGAAESGGPPPIGALTELLGRFETEVEDLRVRVLLDAALPAEAEASARELAEAVANASSARGDRVVVERVPLPSPVERALRDPSSWPSLAGPAAAAALGLSALLGALLLAWGLARGLRRGARELGAALVRAAERRESPALAAEGEAGSVPAEGGGDEASDAEEETRSEEMTIELDVDHVPRLAHLLREQPARNVALVMPYLKAEVRNAYLGAIPPDAAAEVLSAMAPVRYVEPELLGKLKEELERRVRGVVGGVEATAEIVSALGEVERKAVLDRLRETDPETAAAIRGRLLLFEDIGAFDEDALAAIALALGPEEAGAAAGADEALREGFAAAFPGRAGRAFKQTQELLAAAPDPARERAARARAVEAAERLLREEKIVRPSGALAAIAPMAGLPQSPHEGRHAGAPPRQAGDAYNPKTAGTAGLPPRQKPGDAEGEAA